MLPIKGLYAGTGRSRLQPPAMPSDQLYSLQQVADKTDCSLDYIREEVERGRLATTGPNNDRVTEVELERWRRGTLPERHRDRS